MRRFAAAAVLLLAVSACKLPTESTPTGPEIVQGDDNGDGVIMEDESGWDCRAMGNRDCGERSERA